MSIEVMAPCENATIDYLAKQNLKLSYATVAVLMYSREYYRPQNELTELLNRLAPHLSSNDINAALNWLKEEKLLKSTEIQGQYYIYEVVGDFPKRLSECVNNIEVESKLIEMKSCRREKISARFLGVVSTGNNYETLLSAIMNARYSIKYPMLSTAPYEMLVDTLKLVSQNGVRVKILLAEDNIVGKYKGHIKKCRIEDWKYALDGVPNIEIKGFNEDEPTELCTSVLIDEKKLRYVIYDPNTTTSLDGMLLEVENTYGQNINLIKWFNAKFDKAWEQGAKNKRERVLKKIFSLTSSIFICFIICLSYLLCFYGNDRIIDQIVLLLISPSGLYVLSKIYFYLKQQYLRLKTAIANMGR